MKNLITILLTIFFAFSLSTAMAKDKDDDKDKSSAIRAGWQYSSYRNGNVVNDYQPLSSFYAGYYRDNKIIPMLRLGTGIEFSQVGQISDVSPSITLSYLSIPIDLKLKLGPLFVLGGGAFAFKVAEKWEEDGEKYTPTTNLKASTFDIPLFLGLGLKFWFVSVEARYYWGMIELDSAGNKTEYLQVGAAINF